jgi:NADPH:quinone reductase-like Zn-dependent oxidoreductase
MKAMVIREFGGPEVFEEQTIGQPAIRPNDLLVNVKATSVNPVDLGIREAGQWAGVQPPAVIGYDVSGVITEVGDGVTDFVVGQEVFYTPHILGEAGSYAEYHAVPETIVALKPENLSHTEAASLPLVGCTAWEGLIERANVRLGESVLIHGCGGVGSLALQIAKAAGAEVFVTCSDTMKPTAEALGADLAIDYESEDFVPLVEEATDGFGVDVVYDAVGGDTLTRSLDVIKPYGRMVGIVSTDAGFSAAFRKNITLYTYFLERDGYKMDALRILAERGEIEPVIDSVMPLDEVAEAHRRLAAGGVKGKIVLAVDAE